MMIVISDRKENALLNLIIIIIIIIIIIVIIIILYRDILPPSRRGSHVESDYAHTIVETHPLDHIPTGSYNGIPPFSR